ncbi:DNase, putative [Bodo saltans]|uniref:DNase, putative n=1 Tax=Bodo saltans TaxID=75058 RepID=A0A0S4JNN8_BODSA|nr:DNase, putative [Bodo saltans]|eukprot:CUG90732.1 DNase, putative [Bodo saltans]
MASFPFFFLKCIARRIEPMQSASRNCRKLLDIAVNLTDCVFRGIDWKGKQTHKDDFDFVLQRARDSGIQKILVSGTNLEQCERAIALCKLYPGFLYCTVGVHPAHCAEFLMPLEFPRPTTSATAVTINPPFGLPTSLPTFDEETLNSTARLNHLKDLVANNRDVVVAIGEIGLDGAEVAYCPMDLQEKYFALQLKELSGAFKLPLFLHSRECGMQFVEVLGSCGVPGRGGVVHSFNGSHEELKCILDLGLYVGLNASAFRTEETARACCEQIPLSRLMLETDAPWCDARKVDFGYPFISTHFDAQKRSSKFVEGRCVERRNEPCHLIQVLEEYCGALGYFKLHEDVDDASLIEKVESSVFRNCNDLFFP